MSAAVLARYRGWIVLAVVCIAVWPTLVSFHDVWTSYTYSHGYLVAGVALWFGWRRLHSGTPEAHDGVSALASFTVVGLSLVWMLAMVLHFRVVHQGVLPLLLVAWAAAVGGQRGAVLAFPPASLALFAVPFWEVFVPPLQALTVLISGVLVGLMGIGAEISGDIITIPSGRFEVAGSCSGLGFFIVSCFLATTYAYLFAEDWKTGAKLVVSAAVTAMVANWVRVVGLVAIGHSTQMQHSLMTDHSGYGWVIFGLFMSGWLWVVERGTTRARKSEDPTPIGARQPSSGSHRTALATALVLLGPATYWLVTALPAQPMESYASPVLPSDGWTVEMLDEEGADWGPEYPSADQHQRWVLSRDSITILVDRVTYLEQQQGRELPTGTTSLVRPDWVAGERVRWVPSLNRMVKEMLVAAPAEATLLWSWFEVGGRPTATPAWAGLLAVRGFFARQPGAEVFVYRTACDGDSCSAAADRLESMLAGVPGRAR